MGWRVERPAAARALGVAGLALYNWWAVVALDRRLLTTPDELFSDLTAQGRPWAGVLGGADVAAGVLLLAAVALLGPARPAVRAERRALALFAAACTVGGLFPYVCAEGLDAGCRAAEWHLQLPWRHYVHVLAGIVEFGAASAAALLITRRTARDAGPGSGGRAAVAARGALALLAVGYPVMGASYLTGAFGALVEPLLFVAFSVVVAVELFAPAPATAVTGTPPGPSDVARGPCGPAGRDPWRP